MKDRQDSISSKEALLLDQSDAPHDQTAKNLKRTGTITQASIALANATSSAMDDLGYAARNINQVMETITQLSEGKSLITLDDTIKSNRAGKTEEGFAALADEFKALANQTTAATREIKEKVNQVQASAMQNVTHIENISEIITDIVSVILTVTTAVEEQSSTTKEIAKTAAMASRAIENLNARVSEYSKTIDEIVRHV
ncbi:hypothetical protein DSLASN_06340 [Desulfoluna limicola]|uniref:Methyl-accepting transducer domain-containing protein n=1 Tax=Desulfoluna limicola TaxID=2810562 RepID=A0ABN6F117_9BACT|nr:methyl-accepting chemotaxis protein [Desulfoluna limicola]BCS95002.1 hypothetical protein DSLASN_06340 [Desulfoluna limicola]